MSEAPGHEVVEFAFPDVGGAMTITRRHEQALAPELSVVMPCFGETEDNFLRLALNSAFLQAGPRFDVVALTDTARPLDEQLFEEAERDPRLVQLALPGPPAFRAIRYGQAVRQSRGDYVLLLPVPVVLRAGALQDLLKAVRGARLRRDFYFFGGPSFRAEPLHYDLLLREDLLRGAALLIPRELFGRAGLPDPHAALARHFLWDLALRLLRHATGTPLNPSPPLFHESARLEAAPTGPEPDAMLLETVARRIMATDRSDVLLPDRWHTRPVFAADESVLPGAAADERAYLRRLAPRHPVTAPSWDAAPERTACGVRALVLTTCTFLDTANVYIEQALVEALRRAPLHYRLRAAKDATDADLQGMDVLLLSRTLFGGWERALELARRHKQQGRKALFVMDDDLLDIPVDIVINEPIPVAKRFEMFLPWVDGLIVASPALKDRMAARYPRLPIHVIDNSNCVSHAPTQRPKQPRTPGQVRVGLTLTSSALPRLRAFADGLDALPADVRQAVELHVFGEIDPVRDLLPFPNKVFHRHKPYLEYLGLVEQLQLDLAWIPLPGGHDFYRCKTAVKFYEFAGLGVAGSYSRVPIYEAAVEHGVTGWLVNNTSDEWSQAIARLVHDAPLRARLADAARAHVNRHHHVRGAAAAWWNLLQSLTVSGIATAAA